VSLFICKTCGAVENTALSLGFWSGDKRCSECITDVWHGRFKKDFFNPNDWEYDHGEFVKRKS